MNSYNEVLFNSTKKRIQNYAIPQIKYKCPICIGDHGKSRLFDSTGIIKHINASHSKNPFSKQLRKIIRYASYAIELGVVYSWK